MPNVGRFPNHHTADFSPGPLFGAAAIGYRPGPLPLAFHPPSAAASLSARAVGIILLSAAEPSAGGGSIARWPAPTSGRSAGATAAKVLNHTCTDTLSILPSGSSS